MEASSTVATLNITGSSTNRIIKKDANEIIVSPQRIYGDSPFIEANTKMIDLDSLRNDCITPSFSGDNEKTISHVEFIETIEKVAKAWFRGKQTTTDIRVSHKLSGRIPEAMNKPVELLLDHEKTHFFERMAFVISCPATYNPAGKGEVCITIGGVRSYSKENLFGKKTFEKFQLFIGVKNKICTNLCISTDGLKNAFKVSNLKDLQDQAIKLFQSYNYSDHIKQMNDMALARITEKQFAQFIGRARMYNFLPKEEKTEIPNMLFNDSQISAVARDYYEDSRFCRKENGNLNMWDFYNLLTSANKSSYIDSFLTRSVNAYELSSGILDSVLGKSKKYDWYLT